MASDDHAIKTLVCVGGPSAGRRLTLPDHYRTVNLLNPSPNELRMRTRDEADKDGSAFAGSTVYARHALHAGPDHFEYLAPDDMPGPEQLVELLKGYRP